jgi:hypothetical protein
MNNSPVQAAVYLQSVTGTVTATLDMSKGNTQQVMCTSGPSTISLATANLKAGETMTFIFVQPSSATGCTVIAGGHIHGLSAVATTVNSVFTQEFAVSNNGTDLYAKSQGTQCVTSCGTP